MTVAATGARCILAVAATLLLAGCGGGGGGDGDGSSEAKVDRSGYFTKRQSATINPALADYNEAFRELDTKHDACTKASLRLFKAGKVARVAVKCHLDQTTAVVDSIDGVGTALGEIDASDYRGACATQLTGSKSFIKRYRDAWKAVLTDWEAYARGAATSTSSTQRHFDDAYAMSRTFVADVTVDLAAACYTKADRATASKEAAPTT